LLEHDFPDSLPRTCLGFSVVVEPIDLRQQ
jgi:hypothetical protein